MLRTFAIDKLAELLAFGEGSPVTGERAKNFTGGVVRIQDLAEEARLAGIAELAGIDVYAVTFDPGARTRPHVHPNEQLLYFVDGTGFVAFPGEGEQIVEEGEAVIVPPCELHMHGATETAAVCHLAVRMVAATNWSPHVPSKWKKYVLQEHRH